jgi:hypothetical protein
LTKRLNILVISVKDLASNPRPYKEIERLYLDHDINTYAVGASIFKQKQHYQLKHIKVAGLNHTIKAAWWSVTRQWEKLYWSGFDENLDVSNQKYDLIITHDIITMPLAYKIAQSSTGCKIVLDLHEYLPRQWENSLKWRLTQQPFVNALCRKYLPLADMCTIVCKSIETEYKKNFEIKSSIVITNASQYQPELAPQPIRDKIRIITHGVAFEGRCIEVMIDAMRDLPAEQYELYLMLVKDKQNYIDQLIERAKPYKNVFFIPPVPAREVATFTNQFDIGMYILAPVNFNHIHALPNKFFQFVQARLCLAIAPSIEMATLIKQHNLGVVADSFESADMARAIASISRDQIMAYKYQVHAKAEQLSKSTDDFKYLQMINELFEINVY